MQEFEQTATDPKLMSDAEAHEVLRLNLTKTGGAPLVATADIAEAVRIPEAQVETLLAEVRARQGLADQVQPNHKRKVRDAFIALVASLILITVFATAAMRTGVRSTDGEWTVKPATYVLAEGSIERPLATHIAPVNADSKELLDVLFADSEANLVPHTNETPVVSASATIKGLKANDWETPGIRQVIITLSTGPETLEAMLPYYTGTNQTIQKMCADERYSRIQSLLRQLAARARLTAR